MLNSYSALNRLVREGEVKRLVRDYIRADRKMIYEVKPLDNGDFRIRRLRLIDEDREGCEGFLETTLKEVEIE